MKVYKKPFLVLEAGCNHNGDFELAKKMVLMAKEVGADAIKFQKRNNHECLTSEQRNSPHPDPKNSYGKTYGEHRDYLEFSIAQHRELKELSDSIGIIYSSSVWDLTSAKEIASLSPKYIKVPSSQNNNYELLEYLFKHYEGDIQISLGMTTKEEEQKIIELAKENNRLSDIVLLACTSGYPLKPEESYLLEISRLKKCYGKKVKKIGLSGHYTNTALDIAGFVLGAEVIERHFTFDKQFKGTDHSSSLEPNEVVKLINDLKDVSAALARKNKIPNIEKIQRAKLKHKVLSD